MKTTRLTGAEQARFVAPPCPTCGGSNTHANWIDATYMRDTERLYSVNGFVCDDCNAQRLGITREASA